MSIFKSSSESLSFPYMPFWISYVCLSIDTLWAQHMVLWWNVMENDRLFEEALSPISWIMHSRNRYNQCHLSLQPPERQQQHTEELMISFNVFNGNFISDIIFFWSQVIFFPWRNKNKYSILVIEAKTYTPWFKPRNIFLRNA